MESLRLPRGRGREAGRRMRSPGTQPAAAAPRREAVSGSGSRDHSPAPEGRGSGEPLTNPRCLA